MRRRTGDLAILATLALVAMLITRLGVSNVVLRTAVALPLLFFIPGYAATVALFPRDLPEIQERFLISLGMSLAIVILGGLLLNLTTGGVRTELWTLWLGGVTLVACLTALLRRPKQPISARRRLNFAIPFDQGVFIILVTLGVIVAMGIATSSAQQQKPSNFTQLWILPVDGENSGTIRLGVTNMESVTIRYRLKLGSGSHVLREWQSIDLAPGEIWETTVSVPGNSFYTHTIEATLYRLDSPSVVYRWVALRQGD